LRVAWRREILATSRSTPTALTLVPATVLNSEPTAVLRLPQGVELELPSVSPSWVTALARELARSLP
jgi:hypothetical protein